MTPRIRGATGWVSFWLGWSGQIEAFLVIHGRTKLLPRPQLTRFPSKPSEEIPTHSGTHVYDHVEA